MSPEECLEECPYHLAIPDIIKDQRKNYEDFAAQSA